MSDLDRRLGDAGARLRDTAPSPAVTEAALRSLGDVRLDDDRGAGRGRLWIVAPAVLAAAAAIVGAIVLTRPDQQAVVPADTTAVPVASTTTTIVAGSDLGFGVSYVVTETDFDGDAGACITLSTATDSASGCASGATMRSAQPLVVRLDGTPYSFFPAGADGSGRAALSDDVAPCFEGIDEPGALLEAAGCASDGMGIVGVLPAAPEGVTAWSVVGPDEVALDMLTTSPDLRTRVFRSESCVIVAAGDVRELCGTTGPSTFLAGSADEPLVITADVDTGSATVEPLDPATTLDLNECIDLTAGELLALLPEHGVTDSLLCRGDVAALRVAPTLVDPRFFETAWDVLQRSDGTWSVAASQVDYTCTGGNDPGIAGEICSLLDVFDLAQMPPFPTVASLDGFVQAVGDASPLAGRAGIEEVPSLETAVDMPALAEGVAAAMREGMGGDGTVEVFSTSAPIVIRRSNLDDSTTHTIYVLNAGPVDAGAVVFSNGTRAIDLCGRGTTTLDGATVCV